MGMVTVELADWKGEQHSFFVTKASKVVVIARQHMTDVVFDGVEFNFDQDYKEVQKLFIGAFNALNEE